MSNPSNIFQSEPAPIKDLVRRERLHPLGRRILEYQVITVVAPAGYGKTVWVSSVLDTPGWPSSVWVTLDRQDSEPYVLLYHLIRSISRADQTSDPWRTLSSLQNVENEWSIAVAAFLECLPRDRQLFIILDDVHFVYNNKVAVAIIEYILDRLPNNIHIIIIARSAPPFKLYRQEIKDQLLRISSQEFLFSEDEARTLFRNMKLELSDSDAAALYSRTEGWAVGLRLLGIYLQQPGSSIREALQSLNQENSSFYLYIINEFLGIMPADLREFLLSASLLPYLEVSLCNASLARTDSANLLGILRGYGLLLPIIEETGIWRMHNLVEDWLKDIAAKQLAPDSINEIRERAAKFFKQIGDIDRAIEQTVLSKRWDTAVSLIHEYGNESYTQGFRMDSLYKWIGKLPEKLVENDCWLLYFKGMSILYVNDRMAFEVLASAVDMAEKAKERRCEAGAIFAMLLSAIASGDLGRCETAGRRLNDPDLMTDPDSRSVALAAALQYAMARDSLQEGIALSGEAMRLELPPEMSMWVRYTTSYLLLRVGKLKEARQLIEETMSMPYVQENERRLIVGYEILIDTAFLMGDFTTLDKAGGSCLKLGKKYDMLGILGRVHYLKAQYRCREGNDPEATQDLNLAYQYFTSAGVVHFSNQAAVDILLLRINNGENAQEILQQLLELKSKFENNPYGIGIDYMVNSLTGIAALEAGKLELAGQLLGKSAQHWNEIGAMQNVAGTNLLLAHVLLLQGKEKACDNMLHKALGAAEASQWDNFWEWHHTTVYTMCLRAINKNIHPNWSAHILKRWFPGKSHREFSQLLISQNQQLQALASDFFQQNFRTTGKVVLSVFYLGGFRLFVNGLEVEASQWKTKKAENLLKYLVADRRFSNKDLLMQQLWSDGDLESSDGKLRMTLSYVRKALASAGLPPECIVMVKGVITLDSGFEIHCDYEGFMEKARRALSYARTNHPLAVPALEQAIGVYSGEFLPEDIYEDFTVNLRNGLHNLYLEVLSELAQAQFARNNLPVALQTCNKYLALEPVDETIIRMAMLIYWKMNKKYKAIELFRNLKETLTQEYSTAPEQETAALYEKIQSGPK